MECGFINEDNSGWKTFYLQVLKENHSKMCRELDSCSYKLQQLVPITFKLQTYLQNFVYSCLCNA
jgi:hypothetical protein